MGFTPLFKLLILVFLGVIILLEDFRGWKLRKIMRDMSQTQKEIPINCIFLIRLFVQEVGFHINFTKYLVGNVIGDYSNKKI